MRRYYYYTMRDGSMHAPRARKKPCMCSRSAQGMSCGGQKLAKTVQQQSVRG